MTPNEEQLCFYFQIGSAITQWAHIEFGLFDVVSAAFEDPKESPLASAFYSVENFRSKLQLVEQVVALKFRTTPHFDDWIILHGKLESAAKARNKLAHYWVLIYPNDKPGLRMTLMPQLGNVRKTPPKKKPKKPPGALHVKDIAQLSRRFSLLSNALHNYASRLRGQERIPPLPEQEPRPLTLRELRHLIRAVCRTPASIIEAVISNSAGLSPVGHESRFCSIKYIRHFRKVTWNMVMFPVFAYDFRFDRRKP